MKKSFDWRRLARVGAVLVAASLPTMPASSQDQHLEQYSAFAVNLPGARPGDRSVSGVIQITIDGWSTEAERVSLVEAFESGGQERLLRELERRKAVGYVRLPTTLRYDLHFSRQTVAPDGTRRIILATDREMTAYEEAKRPITSEYPFTIIELRVNKDGVGEGRLSALTRIRANKKEQTIELENYGDAPARLTEVKPLR